jgi:tetratricopeptide (TPR) repeat protein
VLAIRSTVLGVAHPETAMMHNNIGLTLKNLGRLDAAAAELEQAQAQVGAALGPSHPSVRIAELNLAGVYYLQRRDVEAADLYAIALGKPAAMAAANRFDLHHVLHWGVSAARCGRIDEARELLEISRARAVALELEGVDANLADLEAEIQRAASTTISAAQ